MPEDDGKHFEEYSRWSVRVDDILVTGKSDAEHLENLELVLKMLHEKGFRLQKSK